MPIASDMGGAGFEPAKAVPPDLQSGPFGRLGIHPVRVRWFVLFQPTLGTSLGSRAREELGVGIRSSCAPAGRAGGETRTHNPRFTKPMLCRLSYASISGSIVSNCSRRGDREKPTKP